MCVCVCALNIQKVVGYTSLQIYCVYIGMYAKVGIICKGVKRRNGYVKRITSKQVIMKALVCLSHSHTHTHTHTHTGINFLLLSQALLLVYRHGNVAMLLPIL